MSSSPPRQLKVLYHLHPSLDTLDFTGPLEILSHATFESAPSTPPSPSSNRVFIPTITAVSELTTTNQNLTLSRDIDIPTAYANLADFDVLAIPGGGSPAVLEGKTEPLGLIKAFAELPKRQDGGIRTIMSVCTGALFLAEAGVLGGVSATTHPGYYGKLREICEGKVKEGGDWKGTKVLEERFVVNRVDEERGLRIVTAGGVSCGLDASLWLVGEVAGTDSRERVARVVQYAWREGVVL